MVFLPFSFLHHQCNVRIELLEIMKEINLGKEKPTQKSFDKLYTLYNTLLLFIILPIFNSIIFLQNICVECFVMYNWK